MLLPGPGDGVCWELVELNCVLVEGAGTAGVNISCCHIQEEVNLSTEELLFVK